MTKLFVGMRFSSAARVFFLALKAGQIEPRPDASEGTAQGLKMSEPGALFSKTLASLDRHPLAQLALGQR